MPILRPTIFLFAVFLLSCNNAANENRNRENEVSKTISPELQSILDSANVEGAILIFDKQANKFYSNNFQQSKEPYLPASTFKIPNSIIGLELGILEDEQTVFKWDGSDRAYSMWEKDLRLKEAFQASCVPCYQELARKIGVERMNEMVEELGFGAMDIKQENIDQFWLIGESRINPFQQIDFLRRLYEGQLPILKSTAKTIQSIMEIKTTAIYSLHGKTGLAVGGETDIGWFVGFVKKEKEVFYFATRIQPKSDDMGRKDFSPLRQEVTIAALEVLHIME